MLIFMIYFEGRPKSNESYGGLLSKLYELPRGMGFHSILYCWRCRCCCNGVVVAISTGKLK